jgi:mono/diheme cytochrome c family protein
MKTKSLIFLGVSLLITVAFLSNNAYAQKKPGPWEVPAKYKTMKNPVKTTNAEATASGKALYAKHCKSCHGAKGLGDGPKAAGLKTFSGDFSGATFQSMTDGELFYKTSFGRDEMPAYDKKIADEADRWALVNYMRTLKK